ncbi:uncharacterized protein DUF5020 [Natronoflexus pectinivorans]|uniref:Uncharacterized protein DUF5020 n=2 Tax=Natronoflexus pectinivorans TaxID=682526 RepID=A0A4R2GFJ8_9BACT|nr:uncharacterized protein DUF5020 [Natronoflexus pectinivorans]
MGKDRGYFTTTLEMFKPDRWGSTFFFVDFDYNVGDVEGVSLAYMDVSRALRFWDSPWALQVEYNGGFGQYAPGLAYQINDAWLTGAQYTWNNADYSRIFTLQGLYKYIQGKHDASFQITGVWTMHFKDRKFTFMGFADFWREDHTFFGEEGSTKFVFLSEPQLWYNVNEHFSFGGEVELATNFAGHKGFKACPTIAVKWTF